MHENVLKILSEIQNLQYQLGEKQRQLDWIQRNCNHDFKHLLNTDESVCRICNLHKLEGT